MTPEPMKDIIDIEGIVRFPWNRVIQGLLGFFIIILVAALAYFIFRWWKSRRCASNPEDHLLPHERAFLEIERLESQKLIERAEYRKYYFFLSEIYRRYLTERFVYPAIDKTTQEILPDLKKIFSNDLLAQKTAQFLKRADMVKFADDRPSSGDVSADKQSVLELIRATIPQPSVPSSSGEETKSLL